MIFTNVLIVATGSLFVLPAAQAFDYHFSPSTPQQCASANVIVTGNDTSLPLDLLLIPYGPLPLSDASKTIYEIPFNGPDPYRINFQVKYPTGTQFVALVGTATGWIGRSNFGRTVSQNPNDNSPCWDSPTPKLPFTFSIYPDRLAQCEKTRIYWNADEVQGHPTFLAVVVNGGWFSIPLGEISDVPGYGKGFIWQPPIQAGLDVIIVAGDIRGNATGGGMVMTVGLGTLFTNMTGDSPSIGQCPPANDTEITYPTKYNNRPFNTGMVIGIVLGVVSILVALAILWFVKRRDRRRQNNAPTVTESKRDERGVQEQRLPWGSDRQPSYYLPEPMTSPNPATQLQFGSPLYYHPGSFPSRGTTALDTPSTGRGEIVMQPATHYGIHTGMGTMTDVLQRPWSATGSGMSGSDTVTMSVASSSSSPTRGLIRTQVHYAASNSDGSDRRDYL